MAYNIRACQAKKKRGTGCLAFWMGLSSDYEADGSVALEGFLEALVEAVVSCLRLCYDSRKCRFANDNLTVGTC